MSPLVSAVVLAHNLRTAKEAVFCVTALKKQTIGRENIQIILVDNGSKDGAADELRRIASEDPAIELYRAETNLGYGAGNDVGIAKANGEYLLVCNPDNVLHDNTLELLTNELRAHPDIGIIAPKLVHEDGSFRDSARRFPSPFDVIIKRTFLRSLFPGALKRYTQVDLDPNVARDADWVVGGCMVLRLDFYRSLGGFDHRFFLFFEDIDICRRTWKTGKRVVYFPTAMAGDRKQRMSEGSALSMFRSFVGREHLKSGWRYFWKWGWRRGKRG